jgi:dolichol-phosphate mannosyltransferase
VRIFKVFIDLLTVKFIGDFSARPNYIFGGFGLVNLALGAASFVVVVVRALQGHVQATPLIFLMVLFFITGVLSLFIGFLAEIVIRGFFDTQHKPTYYVRETVGVDPEP